jgi:hypothetical protein
MANVAQKTETSCKEQLPVGIKKVISKFYQEINAEEADEQLWEMFDNAFLGITKEGVTPQYNLATSYKLFSTFFKDLEKEYRRFEADQKKQ